MVGSIVSRLGRAPEEGIKAPCEVATTANITLSGHQLIGTVTTTDDMRVLVKAQTDTTENAIYLAKSGAWERASDFNAQDDLFNGMLVVESENNTLWYITYSGAAYSPGVSTVTFTEFVSGSAGITSTATSDILTLADLNKIGIGSILATDDNFPIMRAQYDPAGGSLFEEDFYLGQGFRPNSGGTGWEMTAVNVNPSGIFFRGEGTLGAVTLAGHSATDAGNVVGGALPNRPDGWAAAIEVDGATLAAGGTIRLKVNDVNALVARGSETAGQTTITLRDIVSVRDYLDADGLVVTSAGGTPPFDTSTIGGTNWGIWVDNLSGSELKFRDDDNADVVILDAIAMDFGKTSAVTAFTLRNVIDTQSLAIRGGSGVSSGGINMYGSAHATLASDMYFRSASADFAGWDESAGQFFINAGTGGSKTRAVEIDTEVRIGDGTTARNLAMNGTAAGTPAIEFRQNGAARGYLRWLNASSRLEIASSNAAWPVSILPGAVEALRVNQTSIQNLVTTSFPAGTTSDPSITIPHGVAPTSPTNGDIWTTTAGVFARVNGSTIDLTNTTAGAGGAVNTVQYNDSGSIGGLTGFAVNDIATTTSFVGINSQSGLTAGNVLTIDNSSGVTGKTGQVMVVSNSEAVSSTDVLALDQDGAGDLLVLKDAGVEVTVFDGAGYLIDYPGTLTNGHGLFYNSSNSRFEIGPVSTPAFTLEDATDVQAYTHVNRHVLVSNGTNFALRALTVTDVDTAIALEDDANTFQFSNTFQGRVTFQGPFSRDDDTLGTTGTIDVDFNATSFFHTGTLTGNVTFTFSNAPSGPTTGEFFLFLDNAAAATSITWPATIRWPNGTEPTWTANKDMIKVMTYDGSSNYWVTDVSLGMA